MKLFLVASLALAGAVAMGQTPGLPDGDGKAIINGGCVSCHGIDLITAKQISQADWSGILERMKGYGAALDDTQTSTLLNYLTKNFGVPGAAPAGGASDDAAKALVAGVCSSCHGPDLITSKKASQTDWQGIVDRMKGYGATLDDAQTTNLIGYLTRSFGVDGAAPAGAVANAPVPAGAAGAGDAEAMGLISGLCSSCHGADLITSKKVDRLEWQGIVDRMKGYGAALDDRQTTVLMDYLAKTYGTGAAPAAAANAAPPAADAGKQILEGYCAGCHDLDLVSSRKGTRAEWQEIVDRMNGRGAGLAEADVPTLVDYLTRTYGSN